MNEREFILAGNYEALDKLYARLARTEQLLDSSLRQFAALRDQCDHLRELLNVKEWQ